MRQRLSSGLTRAVRVFLPILFVVGMGAGIVLAFVGGSPDAPETPAAVKAMMVAWWLVLCAAMLWVRRNITDVWLDGDRLVVPAGADEWLIPLSAVEDVSEFPFSNPRTIILRVRLPSGELRRVRFLAPAEVVAWPFKPHSVTTFLRERISAAGGNPAGARAG